MVIGKVPPSRFTVPDVRVKIVALSVAPVACVNVPPLIVNAPVEVTVPEIVVVPDNTFTAANVFEFPMMLAVLTIFEVTLL